MQFFRLFDAAELTSRGGAGLVGGHPSLHMFVDQPGNMISNFVGQLRISPTAAEESTHADDEHTDRGHGSFSSIRVTMATVRAQLSASVTNCFFPARVMA